MIKKYMLGFILLFQPLHTIPPHGTAQPAKTALPSSATPSKS